MASSQTLSSGSDSSGSDSGSSLRPLAIYWTICVVVGVVYLRPEVMQFPAIVGSSHVVTVVAGLLAVVVTTVAYKRVTTFGMRSLHLPTLFGFSLANGICETIAFFASFKVGVVIASLFTTSPLWLFTVGLTTFFAYSGAIHALFWLKILPAHLNKSPAVKNSRRVWIVGLVALSSVWSWLFFAFQDFWSVAVLHILFDMGMVYCIRYRLK